MTVKPEDLSSYTTRRDEKGKDLRGDDRETVRCVRDGGFGQMKKATRRVSSRKERAVKARKTFPERVKKKSPR